MPSVHTKCRELQILAHQVSQQVKKMYHRYLEKILVVLYQCTHWILEMNRNLKKGL